MSEWEEATDWESGWWGNCCNTLGEEEKQLLYLNRMGYIGFHDGKTPYAFDLGGISILDVGGGPVSFLLKCTNFKGTVADPCSYPKWVADRYKLAGIKYIKQRGEDLDITKHYDVAIIYNVLQHTEDPFKIIKNMLAVSKVVKIFEWINMPPRTGHPQSFTENKLNAWLGGIGKTEHLDGVAQCWGDCYFGTFKGNLYNE